MGSRGQSGRDKDARDIVGQYSLEGIGENWISNYRRSKPLR